MEECCEKMSTLQLGSFSEAFMPKINMEEALEKPTPLELDKFVSHVVDLYSTWHELLEMVVTAEVRTLKSISEATALRTLGNTSYSNSHLEHSIYVYTKSVAFAPDGSEELALAYANRSASLLHTGKLVECLLDINRALQGNYPPHLRPKLRRRKERCLSEMRAANGKFVHYEGNEVDPIEVTNAADGVDESEFRRLSQFGNALIPRASPKIKLEYDERWGRHVVAAEDIEPGEILSSHEFFVIALLEFGMYRNCCYCVARCHALIPCPSCPQLYCSKKCLSRAKESYHGVECEMMKHLEADAELCQPVLFKALRAVFVGTKQGSELRSLMKKLEIRDIFAENVDLRDEPFADDYVTVLRLSRKFNSALLTPNTMHILKMIVALRHVGFFGNADNDVGVAKKVEKQDSLSEMELYVAMLLMNHVNSLTINQFEINEITGSYLSDGSYEETTIAGGLVSFDNFFNHSCDPNIHNLIRKRHRLIYAVRPIKKGEQIFDTYCGTFFNNSLEDRQERLKSYAFTCGCRACVGRWPQIDTLLQRELFLMTIVNTRRNEHRGDTTIRRMRRLGFIRSIDRSSMVAFKKEIDSVRKRHFAGTQFSDTVQSKREILQTAFKVSKWIDANMKRPSYISALCEYELTMIMKFSFEESSRNFTNASDIGRTFLNLVKALQNYVFDFHAL